MSKPYLYGTAWWRRTPLLASIHAYCKTRWVTPEAVYVSLLSAVSANIPPGVLTCIGTEPNFFAGIVGHVGSGKSTAMQASDGLLALPSFRLCDGTMAGYANHLLRLQQRGRPASVQLHLDSGFSIRRHLFGYGPRIREQFRDFYDGGTIHRPQGEQLMRGTYRVTVREAIYPHRSSWMALPEFQREGDRFVFAPGMGAHSTAPKAPMPVVMLPENWIPGTQPMPSAADPTAHRTRFTLLTCHAALHGRSFPTNADWADTETVMAASDWQKNWMHRTHGAEWRVRNGKPYRKAR